MNNFAAQFAGLATLALAALPVAALTTTAHAATPHAASVRLADLNLATAAGRAAFDERTDQAAATYCADRASLAANTACRAAVRAEVREKLVLAQQGQVQLARN